MQGPPLSTSLDDRVTCYDGKNKIHSRTESRAFRDNHALMTRPNARVRNTVFIMICIIISWQGQEKLVEGKTY